MTHLSISFRTSAHFNRLQRALPDKPARTSQEIEEFHETPYISLLWLLFISSYNPWVFSSESTLNYVLQASCLRECSSNWRCCNHLTRFCRSQVHLDFLDRSWSTSCSKLVIPFEGKLAFSDLLPVFKLTC